MCFFNSGAWPVKKRLVKRNMSMCPSMDAMFTQPHCARTNSLRKEPQTTKGGSENCPKSIPLKLWILHPPNRK